MFGLFGKKTRDHASARRQALQEGALNTPDPLSMQRVDSAVRHLERLLEPLDAGDRNGPIHQAIIEPMNLALANEERLLRRAIELASKSSRLGLLNDRIKGIEGWTDFRTGMPFHFRRKDLIAIALNVGDQGRNSNFQTMIDGYKWKTDDIIAVLDNNLTEQEWLYVSDVWDVYDDFLPEVEEFYMRLSGKVEFKRPYVRKFKPRHFDISIGGYYPQMYDLARSSKKVASENRDSSLIGFDYVCITPPCQRDVDRLGDKLIRINFDLIVETLAQQIHDLEFREVMMQARKIIGGEKIKAALCKKLGDDYYNELWQCLNTVGNCRNLNGVARDQHNNYQRDAL